jgi:hypothetical protein
MLIGAKRKQARRAVVSGDQEALCPENDVGLGGPECANDILLEVLCLFKVVMYLQRAGAY